MRKTPHQIGKIPIDIFQNQMVIRAAVFTRSADSLVTTAVNIFIADQSFPNVIFRLRCGFEESSLYKSEPAMFECKLYDAVSLTATPDFQHPESVIAMHHDDTVLHEKIHPYCLRLMMNYARLHEIIRYEINGEIRPQFKANLEVIHHRLASFIEQQRREWQKAASLLSGPA